MQTTKKILNKEGKKPSKSEKENKEYIKIYRNWRI